MASGLTGVEGMEVKAAKILVLEMCSEAVNALVPVVLLLSPWRRVRGLVGGERNSGRAATLRLGGKCTRFGHSACMGNGT